MEVLLESAEDAVSARQTGEELDMFSDGAAGNEADLREFPGSAVAAWRPTASIDSLRFRARLNQEIRQFFASRGVWEVETPIAGRTSSAHTTMLPMTTRVQAAPGAPSSYLYLQTSPESHMKRLLASGSGPIFQICKAFRADFADATHNPEFTMVEWYRPGLSLEQLIDETAGIISLALPDRLKRICTYAELFERYVGVNPHEASADLLLSVARERLAAPLLLQSGGSREDVLDCLMSELIEPHLGLEELTFVVDFPATQACMARIRSGNPSVAERFELFVDGVEIANAYSELRDPRELGTRFDRDLESLARAGLEAPPKDELLLAALDSGDFPECSGAAIGLDRVIMIALAKTEIADVLAFPFSVA